jgi:hypothetical protein
LIDSLYDRKNSLCTIDYNAKVTKIIASHIFARGDIDVSDLNFALEYQLRKDVGKL